MQAMVGPVRQTQASEVTANGLKSELLAQVQLGFARFYGLKPLCSMRWQLFFQ